MVAEGANVDEERVRRIEELVRRLEEIPDPAAREIGEQLMQAVLELHGTAIEKMMDLVFESGPGGEAILRRFGNDSLISSLLVLHGLHPEDLETRVRQVLAKVPGHAEVVSVLDGVVRIRLAAGGCGATEPDEESLRALLRSAVPDIVDIVFQESAAAMNSFVPLLSINGMVSRLG
jgi:hypothetical protein